MDATQRQEQIVALVQEKGVVQVQWLAEHFGVTPQTLRRDIEKLAAMSAVRRLRGGVTRPSSIENIEYATRQSLMAAEKRAIAQLAAAQVPDDASLFVNIGTTTAAVAKALFGHRHLRIITNNLNAANLLHRNTDFRISIVGGQIRQSDGGIVGAAAVDFIRQFKVDIGIIGISGIDMDGDLLDYDDQEVRVARAIIENARRIFLVADHTKFGRNAMVRMAHIGDVDALFTDRLPPGPLLDVIAASGCRIHVAGSPESGDWQTVDDGSIRDYCERK